MTSGLLRFDRVSLERGGRLLFEELDLTVEPGEAVQVRGPNGSGKSSMLRLAAGLLRPRKGEVHLPRSALADDALALDRELELRCALRFWARLGGSGRSVDDALETLDIAHLADVPVRLLSTGQARRAALARVAISDAPLWLLDEPVNGLDSDGLERLAELTGRHLRSGGGILAASHVPLPGRWRALDLAS